MARDVQTSCLDRPGRLPSLSQLQGTSDSPLPALTGSMALHLYVASCLGGENGTETHEKNRRKGILKVIISPSVGLRMPLSKTGKTRTQIIPGVTDEKDRWPSLHAASALSPKGLALFSHINILCQCVEKGRESTKASASLHPEAPFCFHAEA